MRFQVGKYYKHNGGCIIHIIGAAKTTMYGWCLIAEEAGGATLKPVGQDETHAVNWQEITEEEWVEKFK